MSHTTAPHSHMPHATCHTPHATQPHAAQELKPNIVEANRAGHFDRGIMRHVYPYP